MLEESRRYFHTLVERPPFILGKGQKNSDCVVIATIDKKRPEIPTKTWMQLRRWDKNNVYWTLDLNFTRFIVKPRKGAPHGGSSYYYWAGPEAKPDQWGGPIAFSDIQYTADNCSPKPRIEYVEVNSDEDDQYLTLTNGLRSGRTLRQPQQSTDSTAFENEDGEVTMTAPQNTMQNGPVSGAPRLLDSPNENKSPVHDTAESTNTNKRPLQGASIITPPSYYIRHPTSEPKNDPLPVAARRRKTDISEQELKRLYSASYGRTPPSSFPTSQEPLIASRSNLPVQTPRESAVPQKIVCPAAESIPMPLSKEKQDNTTLWIRINNRDTCIGKKFRSCATISAFFACISKAWKIDSESIELVEVVCDKMYVGDKGTRMIMEADDEDCLEILIDEVDNAPCWQLEKGRNSVDVFIGLRAKWYVSIELDLESANQLHLQTSWLRRMQALRI